MYVNVEFDFDLKLLFVVTEVIYAITFLSSPGPLKSLGLTPNQLCHHPWSLSKMIISHSLALTIIWGMTDILHKRESSKAISLSCNFS